MIHSVVFVTYLDSNAGPIFIYIGNDLVSALEIWPRPLLQTPLKIIIWSCNPLHLPVQFFLTTACRNQPLTSSTHPPASTPLLNSKTAAFPT